MNKGADAWKEFSEPPALEGFVTFGTKSVRAIRMSDPYRLGGLCRLGFARIDSGSTLRVASVG